MRLRVAPLLHLYQEKVHLQTYFGSLTSLTVVSSVLSLQILLDLVDVEAPSASSSGQPKKSFGLEAVLEVVAKVERGI